MSSPSTGIRADLERILERDLLGPWDGDEEELHDQRPRARYLVGYLAPRNIHVQPEEVDTSLSDMDGAEPEQDRATPAAAPTMYPRSMGLAFAVPAGTRSVTVAVSWGWYQRVLSDTRTRDSGDPQRVWRRRPVEHHVEVLLTEGMQEVESPPWTDHPQVRLRTLARHRPERIVVELVLVNDQLEPDQLRDMAWLFQPRLEVSAVEGSAIFLPTHRPNDLPSAEDQHLAMLYRETRQYATGRNVAVDWEEEPNMAAARRLWTEWLPAYELPQTAARSSDDEPGFARLELDMRALATKSGDTLRDALVPLAEAYEKWLDTQRGRLDGEPTLAGHRGAGEAAIEQGRHAARRIRAGIHLLMHDPTAADAFRFANESMALQREATEIALARRADPTVTYETARAAADSPGKRSWRPFQLAFVLLNLPALADPTHEERSPRTSAVVDLLFFPTGGGKTEAYLGLAAFTFAMRRLQGVSGEGVEARDGHEGVAVLMRYTLRLLTAQQFQRAAALVCACEYLRRGRLSAGDGRWGTTPFRIGLWVGQAASPIWYDEAADQVRRARAGARVGGSRVLQVLSCPWCGAELREDQDLEPQDKERRVYLFCSDPDGNCPFSRRQSPQEGLPILTVDEEVYRLMPVMVIGTVDKLAQLPWRGQAGMIFGIANRRCERHGFRHPDMDGRIDCADSHIKTARLPAASTTDVIRPRPPDLIIQDELHLVSGALGTMVGLYETMVDELCSFTASGGNVSPKIISSTATVRRAGEQVRQLFDRGLAVFPPPMIDAGDTFFSHQVKVSEEAPGRRYRGICAHGVRLKQAEIRLASIVLTATQYLFDLHGSAADPYFTCVAYFNAVRELAGMKRLLDDDIAVRVRYGHRKGLADRRTPIDVEELTSRIPSGRIAETLRRLEQPADPARDSSGKRPPGEAPRRHEEWPVAVLLATNMLQVGVDVSRLGLMVVTGQPKNTAEYIQATSRVGRRPEWPGLVLTLYNWARPRDLANFETFVHSHETLYRRVEPLSVTPFAARAVDRGLTGVLVGLVRHSSPGQSVNLAAQRVDLTGLAVRRAVNVIAERAGRVTASSEVADRVRDAIQDRLDKWDVRRKHLEAARLGYRSAPDVEGLLREPGVDWSAWTAAHSLRETEPDINLLLPTGSYVDATNQGAPQWTFSQANATSPVALDYDDTGEPDGVPE